MKRLIAFYVFICIVVFGSATLAGDRPIRVVPLWNKAGVASGSTSTSSTIDLMGYKPNSFDFSVQVSVTNAATNSGLITLSYEVSNDGMVFPVSSNILSGFSQTNSPNADGQTVEFFNTGIARYIRFVLINETRTSNVSAWLCTQ